MELISDSDFLSKISGGQEYESSELAFMNAKNYYINLLPMCEKEHVRITYAVNGEGWSSSNQGGKWTRNLTETCYKEEMRWKNLSGKEKFYVALPPLFVATCAAGVAGKLLYRYVKNKVG